MAKHRPAADGSSNSTCFPSASVAETKPRWRASRLHERLARTSAWLLLIGRTLGHLEGEHAPLSSAPDIGGRVPED